MELVDLDTIVMEVLHYLAAIQVIHTLSNTLQLLEASALLRSQHVSLGTPSHEADA